MQSMLNRFCLIALLGYSPLVWAASTTPTPNAERNYSGNYSCKGNNSRVGDYAYTLTLKLNKTHTHDEFSVYDVSGETENSTMYSGNAVTIANRMSIAFRVSDHKDNIFGSGFAIFKSGAEKLWTFTTRYYEPDEAGGASGTDICTQISSPAKKASEEVSTKKPAGEPQPQNLVDERVPKKTAADEGVNKKTVE